MYNDRSTSCTSVFYVFKVLHPPHPTLQLFNEQLANGVQPSGSTLAMLINAFSVKGMWAEALGLLSSMCR